MEHRRAGGCLGAWCGARHRDVDVTHVLLARRQASQVRNWHRPLALAAISLLAASCGGPPPPPPPPPPAGLQLGTDVLWYRHPEDSAATIRRKAQTVVSYVAGLHANAISVGFPFYMLLSICAGSGRAACTRALRHQRRGTSPLLLTTPHHGLSVNLRPLLNQDAIGGWRGAGQLGGGAAQEGADAYFPLRLGGGASVGQLVTALNKWLSIPRGIGLSRILVQETGIAAQPGSYARPQALAGSRARDFDVQAMWFRTMCTVVRERHMAGIYFWDIDFNQNVRHPHPETDPPLSFIGRRAAEAARNCFVYLAGHR
jgi:hypothetical protein